jgi:hypothetical protein
LRSNFLSSLFASAAIAIASLFCCPIIQRNTELHWITTPIDTIIAGGGGWRVTLSKRDSPDPSFVVPPPLLHARAHQKQHTAYLARTERQPCYANQTIESVPPVQQQHQQQRCGISSNIR